jgi:hypothetical protein
VYSHSVLQFKPAVVNSVLYCPTFATVIYTRLQIPLVHHGLEAGARVCSECHGAQQLLQHLKYLNRLFEASVYEHKLVRRGAKAAFQRYVKSFTSGHTAVLLDIFLRVDAMVMALLQATLQCC